MAVRIFLMVSSGEGTKGASFTYAPSYYWKIDFDNGSAVWTSPIWFER